MIEKFAAKQKKGEQARASKDERILEYKGSEPPIEPPAPKKGKKR